jgi:hypothetical protein
MSNIDYYSNDDNTHVLALNLGQKRVKREDDDNDDSPKRNTGAPKNPRDAKHAPSRQKKALKLRLTTNHKNIISLTGKSNTFPTMQGSNRITVYLACKDFYDTLSI